MYVCMYVCNRVTLQHDREFISGAPRSALVAMFMYD